MPIAGARVYGVEQTTSRNGQHSRTSLDSSFLHQPRTKTNIALQNTRRDVSTKDYTNATSRFYNVETTSNKNKPSSSSGLDVLKKDNVSIKSNSSGKAANDKKKSITSLVRNKIESSSKVNDEMTKKLREVTKSFPDANHKKKTTILKSKSDLKTNTTMLNNLKRSQSVEKSSNKSITSMVKEKMGTLNEVKIEKVARSSSLYPRMHAAPQKGEVLKVFGYRKVEAGVETYNFKNVEKNERTISDKKDMRKYEKPKLEPVSEGRSMETRAQREEKENVVKRANVRESVLVRGAEESESSRIQVHRGNSQGLKGLHNIGNTCFMNSVLQCLSNTRLLLEYLLREDYSRDVNRTESVMKGSLVTSFATLVQQIWSNDVQDHAVNPTNLKSQIQKFAPRFMGYAQQDAQEFLRYLLEGLHQDVNRIKIRKKPHTSEIDDNLTNDQKSDESWTRYLRNDDSLIVDLFVGQLKSTLECKTCGYCSVTFDPFWDLSLPIPCDSSGRIKLQKCLDEFVKEEILDDGEKPECFKCKTKRKCSKTFSIQKFPKILVLHLKRFSPNEKYRCKLSSNVDFQITDLDLSAYAATSTRNCVYNLYAVSNHSGTTYSGHYTAYCRHPYSGTWHEYNDSRVSALSSSSVVSSEAYVLFYELKKT